MAEAIFKHWCPQNRTSQKIEVNSAGLAATEGMPATAETQEVLQEKGINVYHHRAQPVSSQLLHDSDLVIVMTESHRKAIEQQYPEMVQKTKLLKEDFNDQIANINNKDIKDPFGSDLEVYRQTLQEIEEYLKKLVEKLDNCDCPPQ